MSAQALLLDTFHGRLRLEGLLSTRTALHIGAGRSGDPLATDLPVVRDAAEQPYIPGSSLKGVLRSAAEAIYRGHAGSAATSVPAVCNVVAGQPCIDHEGLKSLREEARLALAPDADRRALSGDELGELSRRVAAEVWQRSCPICRLFGSPALAGRVRFPDLPLAGELAPLELRNGVGIQREREQAADLILYDFEAVPPGTTFQLVVVVDNPTDAEVGLLLYLFEQLDRGDLALGGKSTRGLGWVRIDWQAIRETRLQAGNPFRDLLAERDLLLPDPTFEAAAEHPKAQVVEAPRHPATGDPVAWQVLLDVLDSMTTFDKTLLGQEASKRGLSKAALNDRLGLGLQPGEKQRGLWDLVLGKLAEHGALVETATGWELPGEAEAAAETSARVGSEPSLSPELGRAYQRFIGAMATAWQEASACSTAS